MDLWLNSPTYLIKISDLNEGRNFNTFSCPIFPYFQCHLE